MRGLGLGLLWRLRDRSPPQVQIKQSVSFPVLRMDLPSLTGRSSLSDQSLYGSCLKRVRAASTMGTISGILFFQGEADTIDPKQYPALQPAADAWAEKFATFAYNFRQDIGNPGTPLVYAQLGQPDDLQGLPNWALVQQQQENIQIPNAKMIKTNDLPMVGIHYTADSYVVIGTRFAEGMKQIKIKSDEPDLELPQ